MNLNNFYEKPQDVAESLWETLNKNLDQPYTEMRVVQGNNIFIKNKSTNKCNQTVTIELARTDPYNECRVRLDADLRYGNEGEIRLSAYGIHESWVFEATSASLRLWVTQFITQLEELLVKEKTND